MKSAISLLLCFLSMKASAVETAPHSQGAWLDLNKNGIKDTYEDPTLTIKERVSYLVAQMTLPEKLGQLRQTQIRPDTDEKQIQGIKAGEISSLFGYNVLIETPLLRNRLQHIAVDQSRLGIPLIFGHDAIHGFRTIFPIPLALSCAWEPELFERAQAVAAREAAAAELIGCSHRWWIWREIPDGVASPRALVKILGWALSTLPPRYAGFKALAWQT